MKYEFIFSVFFFVLQELKDNKNIFYWKIGWNGNTKKKKFYGVGVPFEHKKIYIKMKFAVCVLFKF